MLKEKGFSSSQKKDKSKEIFFKYFIIKGESIAEEQPNFNVVSYNNDLYIESSTTKPVRTIHDQFSIPETKVIPLIESEVKGVKLYICHLPNSLKANLLDILKLFAGTFKSKPYINNEIYMIEFKSEEAAKRVATFLPHIELDSDDEDEYEEMSSIVIEDSWFKIPAIRFSNMPIEMKNNHFLDIPELRGKVVACQFQTGARVQKSDRSRKTSKDKNVNVIANVVAKTTDDAKQIISMFNFNRMETGQMIHVTWFVSTHELEEIERFKIKVIPNGNEFDHFDEKDFYDEMAKFGDVFNASFHHPKKYDKNDKIFGTVVFVDKNSIENLKKAFRIEYWYANGIIYNFPFGTSENDVKLYLAKFGQNITSIMNKKPDSLNKRILPFFHVSFDSIESMENVAEFIASNPFNKMQPFLISLQKNFPTTVQKYNEYVEELLDEGAIKIENLPDSLHIQELIERFSSFGIITFIQINVTEKNKLVALIAFNFNSGRTIDDVISEYNGATLNDATIKISLFQKSDLNIKNNKKDGSDISSDDSDDSDELKEFLNSSSSSERSRATSFGRGRGGSRGRRKIVLHL